jgi:molybdopterin-synthase adenylyltransferase
MPRLDKQFTIPKHPRIPEDLLQITGEPGIIQLRGGEHTVTIKGSHLLGNIISLLNGRLNHQDIVESLVSLWRQGFIEANGQEPKSEQAVALSEEISEKVSDFLTTLYFNGVLEDAAQTSDNVFSDEELRRYENQTGVFSRYLDVTRASKNRYDVQALLKTAHVLLFCSGLVGAGLAERLCQTGVGSLTIVSLVNTPPLEQVGKINSSTRFTLHKLPSLDRNTVESICVQAEPSIIAMATARPFPTLAQLLNEISIKHRIVWISGVVDGRMGLIGPTVVPGETGCYQCFEARRIAASSSYVEDKQYDDYLRSIALSEVALAELTHFSDAISCHFAIEILRLLTFIAVPATYPNKVLWLDMLSGETTISRFLRLPACRVCSQDNVGFD